MSEAARNIDSDEVRRFSEQASAWWDPNGSFRPLHQIGPARIAFIRDRLGAHFHREATRIRPLKDLSVLDVGCGGGLICEPMRRLGAHVTGIDPGEDTIRAAQVHAGQQGLDISYRAVAIEDVVAADETFDAVLALEVLEHVPDPAQFIATCAKAVRPGGVLIVSTINRTARSFALAIVTAEYVLRWLPRGTHDWDRFLTTKEVSQALLGAGLCDISFEGIVYDPLRDAWRASSDTDVNYMAFAAKPAALS